MAGHLGKALLIANPTAQSGNGAAAAMYAGDILRKELGTSSFELVMTESAGHGLALAEGSGDYDTVIALGGDGVIHDVANGLMKIPDKDRPTLAVLPMGTGNDYARTLKMDFAIENSVQQLFKARKTPIDLGLCNDEYFVETISFGLDAAIALDTVERRKTTGKTGTPLFISSGMDVLLHRMREYPYEVSFDKGAPETGKMLLFAIQIGITYGGGFMICPKAKTDDGLFDICIAKPPLSIPKAVFVFLLAKNAHHTGFKQLNFASAQELSLRFPKAQPPIQIDGEPYDADSFEISCLKHALHVLMPA